MANKLARKFWEDNYKKKIAMAKEAWQESKLEVRKEVKKDRIGRRSPNWKGGISKTYKMELTARDWHKVRREVNERDNYICQKCGKDCSNTKKISTHHIVPWKISHDDSMVNLITLCDACHTSIENEYKKTGRIG